jgi:heat shock protein HslJ/uncharacterized lipoprotein NlpE involved in copper resistance
MRSSAVLSLLLVTLLGGCSGKPADEAAAAAPAAPEAAPAPDMHTSRISLDWPGVYEGVLACEGCPGVHTRIRLNADGSFERTVRKLAPGTSAEQGSGQFQWRPDDNSVTLGADAGAPAFAVGEGHLLLLNADGTRPGPETAGVRLGQRPPSTAQDPGLDQVMQDHAWTLRSASASDGTPLTALFPGPDRPFVFSFSQGRLAVSGGCNGMRGGYTLDASGRLSLAGLASTMMACEPPLMAADAALAAVLGQPLEAVLAQGAAPTLALVSGTGEVLLLAGQLTPEAQLGPAETVFLEIGPQRLPCEASPAADGLCLQAREVSFDAQGLRVGVPGEFQALGQGIDGFEHAAGTRNIVRVKRFAPGPSHPAGMLVLDLVVESETVSN